MIFRGLLTALFCLFAVPALAQCLSQPTLQFSFGDLLIPGNNLQSGAVRLDGTDFSVGDGKGYAYFESNVAAFNGRQEVRDNLLLATSLDACLATVLYLACDFTNGMPSCVLAENQTEAAVVALVRSGKAAPASKPAIVLACEQLNASDRNDAALKLRLLMRDKGYILNSIDEFGSNISYISRDAKDIFTCEIQDNPCVSVQCSATHLGPADTLAPPPDMDDPQIAAMLNNRVFKLLNFGAPVRDVKAKILAYGMLNVPGFGSEPAAIANLTIAPKVGASPGEVFSMDMGALVDALNVSSQKATELLGKDHKFGYSSFFVCADVSFTAKSVEQHKYLSLRAFPDTGLRNQDMHSDYGPGDFSSCQEDFDHGIGDLPIRTWPTPDGDELATELVAEAQRWLSLTHDTTTVGQWEVETTRDSDPSWHKDRATIPQSTDGAQNVLLFECDRGELGAYLGFEPSTDLQGGGVAVTVTFDGNPWAMTFSKGAGTAYVSWQSRAFAERVSTSSTVQMSFKDAAGSAKSFAFDTHGANQALSGVLTTCRE